MSFSRPWNVLALSSRDHKEISHFFIKKIQIKFSFLNQYFWNFLKYSENCIGRRSCDKDDQSYAFQNHKNKLNACLEFVSRTIIGDDPILNKARIISCDVKVTTLSWGSNLKGGSRNITVLIFQKFCYNPTVLIRPPIKGLRQSF